MQEQQHVLQEVLYPFQVEVEVEDMRLRLQVEQEEPAVVDQGVQAQLRQLEEMGKLDQLLPVEVAVVVLLNLFLRLDQAVQVDQESYI